MGASLSAEALTGQPPYFVKQNNPLGHAYLERP